MRRQFGGGEALVVVGMSHDVLTVVGMDPETTDRVISDLAVTQHGVVARRQLRRAGVGPGAVSRRVEAGRLVEVTPRVLRVAGAPADTHARLMAAALDAGPRAVVSHQSAAALWGLPGFRTEPIHVTARRHRVAKGDLLATVHEPRCLLGHHVTGLDGVPVTVPARTLFDLAGCREVSPARLGRLVDAAWSRRLVSFAALHRMLGELGRRGRRGIAAMREVLDERPVDHVPPESGLEARFRDLALLAGWRDLDRQVDLSGDTGWIGRVDFCDHRRRVVFEIGDGLFHGSISDRRRDGRRRRSLQEAGWRVIDVDAFDVFHRSDALVTRLRRLAVPVASGRVP